MFYSARSIIILSILLLAGCATPTKMAFSDKSNADIKTDKAVYLMTVHIKNTYKSSHQPKLKFISVERGAATNAADRLNFQIDDSGKIESDTADGSTYLLRMELEQGEYVIQGFTSISSSFPIHGFFFTPIHEKITVNGSGIFYLGHIEANVRERQGNEFKAGPSIPLIDQAIAGASTGTFDEEITDQWSKDEAKFRVKFSVLSDAQVQMAILRPFDREKAQQWWEAH